MPFDDLVWMLPQAGELLAALAAKAQLDLPSGQWAPSGPASAKRFDEWIENAGPALGLDLTAASILGDRVGSQLRDAAPAIVPLGGGVLGLFEVCRGRARLLAPDLSLRSIPVRELEDHICSTAAREHTPETEDLLEECGIPKRRRARVHRALLEERLRLEQVATVWQLRVSPGSNFSRQAGQAGLWVRLAVFVAAHGAEYALNILAWWVLASGALEGRLDAGWLAAWVLLMLTMGPFRLLTTWSQGLLAVGAGGLLKQRLLAGALGLDLDRIRSEGAGHLLGRVLESELVESLALTGGLLSVLAILELAITGVIVRMGAGGLLQLAALVVWTAVITWLAYRYWRQRERWTQVRVAMTHDLVERMAGHRTRLAQEPPERWHQDEDLALERYLTASEKMDRRHALLTSLATRGWLVVGMISLAPAFLSPRGSTGALAVGLGGLLLGYQAMRRLVVGLSHLAGAAISWKQVSLLFHAARNTWEPGVTLPAADAKPSDTVLELRNVSFHHANRPEPVLRSVGLQVKEGDRLLLESGSGSGKSSLVSIIAGLRRPQSGLLLTGALDQATLGPRAWRKKVAVAPQYQENHVLTAPLAFNLLMGRHWPPRPQDLEEAESVCRELELGPLLDRMPGGLQQMVGESGWQLSSGEKSRLYLARALLQGSNVVVLDESFAALDPETLERCLECVWRRARTLMVVAHP